MLGWWIIVSMQSPEERDSAEKEARDGAILARWEAGLNGIRWIENLVKEAKATRLSRGGYPNRYTARAGDVLQLLSSGAIKPPTGGPWVFGIDEGEEYALPPGWIGRVEVHADRIADCDPDCVLTIDAWDQS